MPAVAVLGCGAVVDRLYRGPLRRLESRGLARVVALVDPNIARAAGFLRDFPAARPYASALEAFRDRRVDVTLVASPPGLHAEHAVSAFEHGSHVLCEKPLATGLEQGEAMVRSARQTGRILAVGMTRRFYPCFAVARELIGTGELGGDLRFVYREGDVFGWPSSTDAAFRRGTAGGGVLMDVGAHVLDWLGGLFGPPDVRDYEDDALGEGVEANCRLRLEFPEARGIVQLSWNQPLRSGLHVRGPAGELRIDGPSLDCLHRRRGNGPWETLVSRHAWPADLERPPRRQGTPRSYYDCIFYQLVQFLRAVAHGERVPVDGADALLVSRAVDECYRRARPLAMPWRPAPEQEAAAVMHWKRGS